MNLLVIAPEYPPNVIGGGGAVYESLAQGLAGLGHDVTVVYGDITNRSPFAKSLRFDQRNGVHLIGVPLLPAPPGLNWAISATPVAPLAATELRHILQHGDWDVAHVHGIGFPLVNGSARILAARDVPYVVTAHGVPRRPFARGGPLASIVRSYLEGSTRRMIDNASSVTGISRAVLEDPNFPIGRGTVIPNGIDTPVGACGRDAGPRVPLRVLSISRLSANKGIDVAIKAVALLRKARPVEYDIYGSDGGDERALRALVDDACAGDYVRFRGTFASEARERLFADHDVLLVPSRVEGFGLAALEGLAAGIPVIAAPVDGLGQFLSAKNAVLVPNHDPVEWSEALELIATESPADASRRIAAGLRTAGEFAWEPIVRSYESRLSSARTRPRAESP